MSTSLLPTNQGDHKPVSAFFQANVEAILPAPYQEIHAAVLRELDRLENDARPSVVISSEEIHFDKIFFLEPVTRAVTLENTGTVRPKSHTYIGNRTL